MAAPPPPPTVMIFQFNDPINESVQAGVDSAGNPIGDVIYYCPNTGHGGFQTVDNNIAGTGIVRIGLATSMSIVGNLYQLTVTIDPFLSNQQKIDIVAGYSAGDFIMFSKDTETNRNSLLGYYAEVRLGNDSPDIAELFMVSTEVAESSK